MAIDAVGSSARATERGTLIVKKGNEMDKNAFLRILTAELSNQNPDNAKDSTQYVAQLAQFASLEQMTNLNSTMSFAGASSMIGSEVKLNSLDSEGMQYKGLVKSVSKKDGGSIVLGVEVEKNGNKSIKEFLYSEVAEVGQSTAEKQSTKEASSSNV
jgi:flagellar basal-body rod modification protein FlgD